MTYMSLLYCVSYVVCVCEFYMVCAILYLYYVYCATPCIALHAEDDDGSPHESDTGNDCHLKATSDMRHIQSYKIDQWQNHDKNVKIYFHQE